MANPFAHDLKPDGLITLLAHILYYFKFRANALADYHHLALQIAISMIR